VGDEKRESTLDWDAVHQRLEKVNAALEALGGSNSDASESAVRQIWARRAAVLAKVPLEEDDGEQIELVVMRLGEEFYALEARFVFDIRPFERITHVPRTPAWVAGVVNHRGRILSVIDLRRFFNLPTGEPGEGDGDSAPVASVALAPSDALAANANRSPLSFSEPISKAVDRARLQYIIVVEVHVAHSEATSETPVVSESKNPVVEFALLTGPVLTVKLIPVNRIQDASRMVLDIEAEYVRGIVECDVRGEEATVIIVDLPALLADERLFVHEEVV
jgi:chemotaxis signal transduction protein